jgi:hypothetical protein
MKNLIAHGIGVLTQKCNGKVFIEVVATGKLTHEDYQIFIPIVERALKEAKKLEVDLFQPKKTLSSGQGQSSKVLPLNS